MNELVTPMIHVPDVRATVDWYQSIGFRAVNTYGNETADGLSFAIMAFGNGQVMFNQGGETSTKRRREVDLYAHTDDVDALYSELKDRVDVIEGPHNTFYGMREVIIRDLNGFWITFGQESTFGWLMGGVNEGNAENVRKAIDSGQLKLETLKIALAAALVSDNAEIVEMLKQAGATPPPQIDVETLQSYVGVYQGEQGPPVEITLKDGRLFAAPGAQEPISLWPLDQVTFKPIAFDNATVIFNSDSITFIQDGCANEFRRIIRPSSV
ncbi:MAG TPA: VOC family protein [Pyrinomonadaceae bacterium]|jgi:catechol 2,3-dioxygenase-like lactoylglutathione lyase family enzyme|nr:VOC family protein [Pyrinomonadaceae bacterium]